MPKERRRRKPQQQQQHRRQEPARNKPYAMGGHAAEQRYKPGFPMNLMQNTKLFWIVGGGVMIGSMVFAAVVSGLNPSRSTADVPTRTPTPAASPSGTPDPNASATPSATATAQTFTKAEQVVDQAKTYTATIKTDKGDIVMDLFDDKSPRTVNTFVFLAQQKYFDGTKFYRVDPGFVVQTGSPANSMAGPGPGFTTEEDQNDLSNKKGFVSMAKKSGATEFSDQWFINLKDNPGLDQDNPGQKRFYPFAQVRPESMAVVEKLTQDDVMRSVTIEEK